MTDANLLLGRIPGRTFERLHAARAEEEVLTADAIRTRVHDAFASIASPLGIAPEEAAAAAVRSVEASMARALRVISTQRGRDPRGAALVCFGGAGPLHGAALAAALRIGRVVVPPYPGVLSAFGLAGADARRDYVRALMMPLGTQADLRRLEELSVPLREQAFADARALGEPEPLLTASVDLRYHGQSHEIEVPLAGDVGESFHAEHERRYGHADRRRGLDLVHVRVRAVTRGARPPILPPPPPLPPSPPSQPEGREGREGREKPTVDPASGAPERSRASLAVGDRIAGPVVLREPTATTWIPPGWQAHVAACGSLVMTPAHGSRTEDNP